MAKFRHGILGPISGKLGPIVGATWKGVPYLRTAPKQNENAKRSPAQLANQQRFKFLNHFLTPFHPYLNNGFRQAADGKTEINAGFTANYRLVTGESPEFMIDLSQLVLSKGDLAVLHQPVINYPSPGVLELSWVFKAEKNANFDDQLMIVVYSPELHKTDGTVGGIKRAARRHTFLLDERFHDKELHVYIVMMALSGKLLSDTIYLGKRAIQ